MADGKKHNYSWDQLRDVVWKFFQNYIPALAVALWDHMQHEVQKLKNKNAKLESEKKATRRKEKLRDENEGKSDIEYIDGILARLRKGGLRGLRKPKSDKK